MSVADDLARFVTTTHFADLPPEAVHESKRILVDSLGCAIAAVSDLKGSIAIEYAGFLGGTDRTATIVGSPVRSSIFGAAFANGELINALDFDAVLPPGHVSPYVLPAALAVAEAEHVSGEDLLVAVAISHEMSNRFGRAMDYIRDTASGQLSMPSVLGYTSTVFGATAAITKLYGASEDVTSQALAIAGSNSPVNSHRSWLEHVPTATIKYTMAGPLTQTALTAAFMAMLGHRGDPGLLDDAEFGYPRFIGTTRWAPDRMMADLGHEWHFPRENSFKHYPHCRAQHGLFDLLDQVLAQEKIHPREITAIRAEGEGHVERPLWLNSQVSQVVEAQFSIAHGLAVAALRLEPSKLWQSDDVVFSPEVQRLTELVSYRTHPEWLNAIAEDPLARPSRIEVDARGTTYAAELRYPRGTAGDVTLAMSDAEVAAKFAINVRDTLSEAQTAEVLDILMSLESVRDVAPVLASLGGGAVGQGAPARPA